MTTASSSRRVPQGEVVMEFADGGSYIQSKMETAVLELERKRITLENEKKEKKAAKAMEALNVSSSSITTPKSNSEDLNLIISQLGCTKEEAEEALNANKGDLVATLIKMVQPRQRAKSVDAGGEIRA